MSSSTLLARPTLAMLSFSLAGAAWSGLFVSTGMMLASEGRFVGNPLYTLAVGVAITATVVGIQLRCHRASFQIRLADAVAFRRAWLPEPTIEMRPPTRYVASAAVAVADTAEPAAEKGFADDIESELRGWIARDFTDPPSGDISDGRDR